MSLGESELLETTRVLAVIPARSGSKRVPEKNIRDVGGKPLIAHTIEQANEAVSIDRAVVSTEDEKIANIAESYNGDVPFTRPERLATDTATNTEVISHALNWFEKRNEYYDVVCLLLVTNPFRTVTDIEEALRELITTDATAIMGVTEYDMPPVFALTADEDGYLDPYFDDQYFNSKTRTQDVPTLLCPNGAFYAADVAAFRENESFLAERTVGYEMSAERSIDIDEPIDLKIARLLMSEQANEGEPEQ